MDDPGHSAIPRTMLYGGTGSGQFLFYARYQLDLPGKKLLIFKGKGKVLTKFSPQGQNLEK